MTLKKLTDRQIVEFALSRPRDPDELWNYVRVLFNISIPRKAVTEDSVAPFTAFERAYFAKDPVAVWIGARGTGKAQSVDSMVLTPHGYVRMGDIRVGDTVVDAGGNLVQVIAVHPQGRKQLYEVKFNDGTSTQCCGEHLWRVRTGGNTRTGARRAWRVLDTLKLRDTLRLPRGDWRWRIPVVEPIKFPEATLPIHPYVLGVLLGDGSLTHSGVEFTKDSRDEELVAKVESLLNEGLEIRTSDNIRRIVRNLGTQNPLVQALKSCGLRSCKAADKFIPPYFLYGSTQQRLDLLQGLMDTDGSPGSSGGVDYCTASKQLLVGVTFLVQSLGGTVTRCPDKVVNGVTYYRIYLKTPMNPFSLYRKAALWIEPTKYPVTRIITSIEPVGEAECQCITVDSPTHTYLTNDCIVTHNSVLLALLASVELLTLKCNISIIAGSRDQSERVLKYLRNEDANMAGILWGAINAPRMLLNEDLISKKTIKTIPGLLGGETDPGFEIVAHASSEASVRGVHPSRLRYDECDVAEYETIESSRGCTSSIRGIDTQTVYSSTYHKYNGTMTKIIKEAKQKGWPVYCLWEESKVLTEFGIEKRIKDLQIGELVLTREGWKPTTHVTFMGYKPTIILELSNGRRLTLTSDHKVATPSGWVEAGTLSPLSKVIGSNMIKRTNYSITHVEVVSVSESGHVLPVWDIGVKDCHEFLAEGVIVHNCWTWREVMESNGGFMSQKFIDTKRGELSQAQWDAEYENKGPQSGVRVFDKSHLDILFNPRIGNIPGAENSHWKLYENDKNPTGRFYHGADWARDNHWTVLHTLQRTASGFQTAAWYRTNQKPYPQIIREVVSHIKDYKGPIAHDSTGVGKALDDLLVDNGVKRSSVFPVEWTRQKLIHEMAGFYQHAIENEELVGPFIQFAYSEHEYLTEDMLRGKDHCPDSVAAAMMAYYLARQYAAGRNCVVMRIQ